MGSRVCLLVLYFWVVSWMVWFVCNSYFCLEGSVWPNLVNFSFNLSIFCLLLVYADMHRSFGDNFVAKTLKDVFIDKIQTVQDTINMLVSAKTDAYSKRTLSNIWMEFMLILLNMDFSLKSNSIYQHIFWDFIAIQSRRLRSMD